MEREAFRQRMQQYKQARESNPQLKYWDWKKYADGTDKVTPPAPEVPYMRHNYESTPYSSYSYRKPFDSVYEDPTFTINRGIDLRKDVPKEIKGLKISKGAFGVLSKLTRGLRIASPIVEVVQNLFPSEEAEIMEEARVKYKNWNSLEPKMYSDGGEVRDNIYVAPIYKEYEYSQRVYV